MISVCMATYNGGRFIKQQIDSVLLQLEGDDEIIISDDSSTDNTIEIIKSYKNNNIKLLENNDFRTPISNFENAIKHASGSTIFLSDQDDIWMPNKVSVIVEHLKQYDLVVSDAILIDAYGTVIEESFYKLNKSCSGFIKNIYKNSYLGCCMAFNRNILEKSLPFPTNIPMHDIWIGMISEIYGSPLFCKEKLVSYRRHASNTSTAGGNSSYSILEKIKFRCKLLSALAKRYLLNV